MNDDETYALAARVSAAASILTGNMFSGLTPAPVEAFVQIDRDSRVRISLVAEERVEGRYHDEGDSWRARR